MKKSKILKVIMLSAMVCIASASCQKVNENRIVPVTGVTFNEDTVSLIAGNSITLVPVVIPDNATNKKVSLSSDNSNIATINSSGLVTGVATGTTFIIATTADGGKKDSCTVIVKAATISVTGITLTPTTISLSVNGTAQITANILPQNATDKNVNWSSDNTNIATIDANGNVTAKSVGTAIITATTVDGGKTATCTVTVIATNPTATITWFISTSTNAEGSPAGTAQKMKDALSQIRTAKSNNSFANNKKAVIVVNGTITPTTEGSLLNKSLVSITGVGQYPPVVLRGSASGGILDANNSARVLYVMNNNVTIADNITLINGNTHASNELYGGGVFIEKSSLAMTGGNIKQCKALYGGGIYISEDKDSQHSSFLMNGGTISDCQTQGTASTGGAGVFVERYCSFTMVGGSITNNGTDGKTDTGGGIFVNGYGVFNMSGGKINGNKASSNGGGVHVTGYGNFNMTNGTITENTAPDGGGSGVFVSQYGATFNQTGGIISGNYGNPDIQQ
ncbi:MAG: Ig-like domain-containing protein [Prevotellaceae bacterium]|jgi:uncharacterized protein YjdB|nr:Ig-like domain-containing protein [Prevotellaceae bacterium]